MTGLECVTAHATQHTMHHDTSRIAGSPPGVEGDCSADDGVLGGSRADSGATKRVSSYRQPVHVQLACKEMKLRLHHAYEMSASTIVDTGASVQALPQVANGEAASADAGIHHVIPAAHMIARSLPSPTSKENCGVSAARDPALGGVCAACNVDN